MGEMLIPLPRKASSEIKVPVPQTDTGRRGESKVCERTLDLGTRQNDPVTSGEGVLS